VERDVVSSKKSGRDVEIVINTLAGPAIALAMTVGQADLDHQAVMRARSYELAIARGHMRQ
jgi:hypothetical protein